MIVDGNSLIHRGFHAIPHLSTSKGFPTNGVYGFVTIFLNAVKQIEPTHIAVAFDTPGGTFRDKLFPDYKAKRVRAPQELYDQIPKAKEFVRALNLPVYEKPGYEGDDVIGTIVRHEDGDVDKVIVTGDLDALQLIDDRTSVWTTKKGLTETVQYDPEAVLLRYGFGPEYVVDFKALRGDASDNIPGVRGIGEKGAIDLIKQFGHVEDMYAELDKNSAKAKKLSPAVREKLLTHREDCLLSKKLATIDCDAPIEFSFEATRFGRFDASKIVEFLQEMEFRSLLNKIPRPAQSAQTRPEVEAETAAAGEQGPGVFAPIAPLRKNDQDHRYTLVETQEQLDKLIEKFTAAGELAVDTETTSEKEMEADLLGISLCSKSGEAYYVPARTGGGELDLKKLYLLLADKSVQKIGHNLKYDYLVLRRAGCELAPMGFDTMIAAYLLNPGSRGYSLDDLAFARFGYQMQPITELIGKGKSQINFADVPLPQAAWYSSEDADYTRRLAEVLAPELEKEGLQKVFEEIDMPLVRVLALMEENGIAIDPKHFASLDRTMTRQIGELTRKIHELGQGEFNINSPQQLKEVLFERLRISTAEIKKTKTGLSTAASELEKLRDAHPIVELIMEYRELSKLKSTYIDALPQMVNRATGRIHTSYNQTIAATGRLSSTEPNLQNIPIRTELGNRIREGFVAAKGKKLLSLDYSQIELRVVAHLSGDEVMGKVFRQGKDIHTATAAEVFEIAEDKVGKDERRYAKVINFGVLYGLSAYGFTQQIPGVTRDRAQAFIDKYFLTYRGVKNYIDEIIQFAKEHGYVANQLGRKRYLPEINASQFPIRAGAERAAINTPIQGLAADIIKVAMINIDRQVGTQNPECRMLLQVHDELVFEVDEDKAESYARKIKKIMEAAIELSVPVVVESKVGTNWGEMEEISL